MNKSIRKLIKTVGDIEEWFAILLFMPLLSWYIYLSQFYDVNIIVPIVGTLYPLCWLINKTIEKKEKFNELKTN